MRTMFISKVCRKKPGNDVLEQEEQDHQRYEGPGSPHHNLGHDANGSSLLFAAILGSSAAIALRSDSTPIGSGLNKSPFTEALSSEQEEAARRLR